MISVCRSAGRDDANIIGFLGVMVNPVWHGNTDHAAILRKEASQAVTKSKTESGKARAKSAPRDANGAFQKKFQKKKKNPLTAYEGKQRYAAG